MTFRHMFSEGRFRIYGKRFGTRLRNHEESEFLMSPIIRCANLSEFRIVFQS
jgi:hypothetical protein